MSSSTPKSRRRVPDWPHLDGYQLESILGRGATGTVFRARQEPVGREVAVKVLHPEFTNQARIVQRLQREARTSARLAHPSLVSAVDMGETDGRWWYAMEFVDGPSLALRLREEGPMKEREALRVFIPLCQALEHLWEHGVTHRDIKPANILIARTGGARLADLGLAFADDDEEDLTKQGGTLGTPAYISPEQAVDPRDADVRSDIWSFGATLFHAVCGRPPFRAESAAEVLSRVLYAKIPDPRELEPNLSKGLALVLRKCLSRDQERRYQTPTELLGDLERIRERRAPRVRRGQLDPVQTPHDPTATWKVVGVIALLGGALVIWGIASLADDEGSDEEPVTDTLEPFAPLEDLARRAGVDPTRLAQQYGELAEFAVDLPDAYREQWMGITRGLRDRLKEEVGALQEEFEPRIDEALAAHDYARAWQLRDDEYTTRILAGTGFRTEGLARELPSNGAWLDRISSKIESAETTSRERLRSALDALRTSRLQRIDRLLADQKWKLAREVLLTEDDALLADAGFEGYRFRSEDLEALLAPVRIEFGLRRQQLDDAWLFLDQELRREVVARSELLRGQLEEGGQRFPASVQLRVKFDHVLEERDLTRDQMPGGLPQIALAELEERVNELVLLEDRLLEEDARRAFAETERACEAGWAGRRYREVEELWRDAARRLELPGGIADAPWRVALARKAELRREEARRLRALLEQAALRLVELDGEPIELRVRGILYTDRRVAAGLDPLAEGFALEGIGERLDLRTLATSELEQLVAPTLLPGGDPELLLAVALLRYRDGEYETARLAVNAWELPDGDDPRSLATDLRVRVTDAVEDLEQRRGRRREEATRLLALATDPTRIEQEATSVGMWIDELLGRYEDLPEVKARRPELLAIRDSLRKRNGRAGEAELDEVFGPTRITLPDATHVRMEFDFQAEEVGAWRRGDWVFDNLGWVPNAGVDELDELPRQKGPSLVLEAPLDIDAGPFDLTLRVERPAGAGPHRLLLISAAGFHVALIGPRFGGDSGESRLVVHTGTIEELIAAIRRGEGERVGPLFVAGRTHEVTLTLNRRSGRLKILLDGRQLARPYPPRPDPDVRSIMVRSWDRTRLLGAILTARR